MENIINEQLVNFLRALANAIESNKILPKRLHHIGEFFMAYQFQEQVEKDNNVRDEKDFDPEDVMRFIVLGWYVYRIILRNEQLPSSSAPDL